MSDKINGPWTRVHRNGKDHIKDASGNSIMCDETYYPSVPNEDAQWNLIASAPELYEALKELVDAIEDAGGHDENGDVFDIRNACAAIAKAEGR